MSTSLFIFNWTKAAVLVINMNNRIKLLNTEVDNLTLREAVLAVIAEAETSKPEYVVTPNVDHIVMIEKNLQFKNAYQGAKYRFVDGQPLVLLSKLAGKPLKEKVSGSDLFPEVCAEAAKKGKSIFLLGGRSGVAETAAENLQDDSPRLHIAGTYSPKFGFENNPDEISNIINIVTQTKPDILFVCLGSPKAELFIYEHYLDLNVPVTLSVGAAIDFTAGTIRRAPKWVSNHGLEWMFRLFHEPRRLAGRYIKDLIHIIPIIIKNWD